MDIYLDNAATTRTCPEAIEEMGRVLSLEYGNPASHHAKGRQANKILQTSRETIAHALGSDIKDIYFTSGGTEANNWAITGCAHKLRHKGRHIVSTAIEHDSVLSPLEALRQQGYEITLVRPERSGIVTAQNISDALRDDTILVSVMLANNETGAILPVDEIVKSVRTGSNALIHVDAVHGFMKIPFTAKSMGADFVTISAHKIHGPKGVGALYIKDKKSLSPIITGGAQQSGLRGGTEPLHNIAGFAQAVRVQQLHMADTRNKMTGFQDYIRRELEILLPCAEILPAGLGDIMSISLPGYQGETIMNFLDYKNICVSRSSACKNNARSHVLEAMGLSSKVIDGTIRVSFSRYNTDEEIREFVKLLVFTKENIFPKL